MKSLTRTIALYLWVFRPTRKLEFPIEKIEERDIFNYYYNDFVTGGGIDSTRQYYSEFECFHCFGNQKGASKAKMSIVFKDEWYNTRGSECWTSVLVCCDCYLIRRRSFNIY